MLLDMGEQYPSERNRQALRKMATAFSATARETDLTEWYRDNCTVGVMFTEIGFAIELRSGVTETVLIDAERCKRILVLVNCRSEFDSV
jgi:hypothetical protein